MIEQLMNYNIDEILNFVIIGSWLLIGVVVLFNFLVGFKRGTKKSLYYSIASLVSVFIILLAFSFFTIRWFIPSAGALIDLLEKYNVNTSGPVFDYISDPALSPVVFALLDIILKIVLFIILYPILKLILHLILFRPIYKKFVGTKITKEEKRNDPSLGKKTGMSRLTGGLIGGIRGFIFSFLVAIPLILLIGTTNGIVIDNANSNKTNNVKTSNEEVIEDIDEVFNKQEALDILEKVKRVNDSTLVGFSKNIKFGKKSIDELIFDFGFSGKIKNEDGTTNKLELAYELRNVGNMANGVLNLGFLEDDFSINNINYDDHYKYIEAVFTGLGDTNLTKIGIPIALEFAINNVDQLKDLDIRNNAYTMAAYTKLRNIDWSNEFNILSTIAGSILKIGSMESVLNLLKTDGDIELDDEVLKEISSIISKVGNLSIFYGANIGLEYLISNEILPKVENGIDYETYYHDKLSFIFDNPGFLLSETGQINKISTLINNVIDLDLDVADIQDYLTNNELKPESLLETNLSGLVSEVLRFAGSFDLVTKSLPIVADYFLYSQNSEALSEGLVDDLSNHISNINFNKEFAGIDNIYKEVVSMAILNNIKGTSDTFERVDNVLKAPGNMDSVRKIVNEIFVNSDFISNGLNMASEFLVGSMMNDSELKDFLLTVITNEDFEMGLELVTMFELLEQVYKHTSIKEVTSYSSSGNFVGLAYNFVDLSDTEMDELLDPLFNLQILTLESPTALRYLASMLNTNLLVINDEITPDEVKYDLRMLIDVLLSVGRQIKENNIDINNYQDVVINKLIDSNKLIEIINFDNTTRPNSFIASSLVGMLIDIDLNLGGYFEFKTPVELKDKDSKSNEWNNELNTLTRSIIRALSSDALGMSFNELKGFSSLNTSSIISIINGFTSSMNGVDVINSKDELDRFTESLFIQYTFDSLVNNDLLEPVISNALSGITNEEVVFSTKPELDQLDVNNKFSSLEIRKILLSVSYLNLEGEYNTNLGIKHLFELLDSGNFDNFLASNYIRTLLSRILTNESILHFIEATVGLDNDSLTLNETIKDSNNNLVVSEIRNLVIAFKELGILDLANINISIESLTSILNDESLDKILESNYMYQLIDLLLKKNIANIPAEALSSTHTGYIAKEEIKAMINTFNSLGISDVSNIGIDSMDVNFLDKLINQDSVIIRSITSKELIKIVDFPEESYEGNISNELILKEELVSLLEVVKIITNNDEELINDLDFNNLSITIEQLKAITLINDETGGSPVVNRILSNVIIEAFSNIPTNAYTNSLETDIKRDEIKKIVSILDIIGLNDISEAITPNNINTLILVDVVEEDSIIMNKLLSDEVIVVLGDTKNIPNGARVNNDNISDLTTIEMSSLFRVLDDLVIDMDGLTNIDANSIEISKLVTANTRGSLIFKRLVSIGLIDISRLKVASSNLIILIDLVENNNLDIIVDEFNKLINNLDELGFNSISHLIDSIDNYLLHIPELTTAYTALVNMPESDRSQILVDTLEQILP